MSDRLKAYARAGVDVDLGNKVKAGIPALVQSANRPEVLGKVGGFGGLFSAKFPKMRDPVLVASIASLFLRLGEGISSGTFTTKSIEQVT